MYKKSIWQKFSKPCHFPRLKGDIEVDVAIIGGGISGITTAQLLASAGKKVVVLEALKIAESNTGRSTGNLYSTLGGELTSIRSSFKREVVEKVVKSRKEALNLIERNIIRFEIECEFIRVPWYFYSAVNSADSIIEKEFKVEKELGLIQDYSELPNFSLKSRKAIMVEDQAQFNPLTYVQGLARSIASERCQIFEDTKVSEVISEGEVHELVTAHGRVRAQAIVHATHTPKGLSALHTLLGPYREYGIACKLQGHEHPPGIFFGYHNSSELISTRMYEKDGEYFLIVVGEPHKVGQGDSAYHIGELEKFASKYFNVSEITHRWGGQHYKPTDHLPYIGRLAPKSNVYMASGFSTHGLVYGTVAGQVISDLILKNENEYADIYKPLRFNPIKSAPKFIKENTNVLSEYIKDYLLKRDRSPFSEVGPGEGKILQHEGKKLAVFRDEKDNLQVCSAICTHLGCVVHWNKAEASWDCPCHGSRFDTKGEVLEGPAYKALERFEVKEELKDHRPPKRNERPDIQQGV